MMRLISTKICKTKDIGINNNLFGGSMLAWLDESGGTMAAEETYSPNMITLKIDEVLFKKPVKVNDHIRIYGKVLDVGKSSLSLYLEARRFCFDTRLEVPVCSTKMLFVNIDENGHSKPIADQIQKKIRQSLQNNKQL
nr:acyl-CoA thioesterase [Bacteroidota bacterium]